MEILTGYEGIFFPLAIVLMLYMAWGIGSNDLSNSMGPAVGARAFGLKEAVIIAAIFELAGALTFGSNVTDTVGFDIIKIPPESEVSGSNKLLIYAMLASLLATSLWLTFASAKGWPVSTTHSIIGAIVGSSISVYSTDAINWERLTDIFASWLISPLMGAIFSFALMCLIFFLIKRRKSPVESARFWMPIFFFATGFAIGLIIICKLFPAINLELGLSECLIFSTIAGAGMMFVNISTQKINRSSDIEVHFIPLTIITGCSMAFAHGANDIANLINPLSIIVHSISNEASAVQIYNLPVFYYFLGSLGIIVGMATLGFRVVKTVGTHITTLTPSKAFCASLAASGSVVTATQLGLPVSTTHTLVGALIGVGIASGIQSISVQTVKRIIVAWLITLPVTSMLAALLIIILPVFI